MKKLAPNLLHYLTLVIFTVFLSACSSDNDVINNDTEDDTEIMDGDDNDDTQNNNTNPSQPNILLIIADDMGLDATPGYTIGNIKPSMPNLESLTTNGIKFTNVWSSPLCTPTRAGIITGKYGFRTGVTEVGTALPVNEQSLQGYLDAGNSGYSHAVIGKWHLANRGDITHPNTIGIDTFSGFQGGGVPSYFNWSLIENMQSANSTTYTTTKFTDLAIDWIGQQDQPWFLWLAYNAPHTPFHLPPNDLHKQGALPTDQASIDANPLPYYLAMLEAMDTEMGRLLSTMDTEVRNNTIIIFVGDNGTPNQVVQTYRSRRAKNSLYQGGINVPMVISGRNVTRRGVEEHALLNTIDLFATIAGITGADIESINDSNNFESMFSNSGVQVRDYAYSEIGSDTGGEDFTIRDASYKLIRFTNGDEALYNLNTDPLEATNLLNASQLPLSAEASTAKANLEAELIKIKQ